jgi:hypothetical protein
MYRASVLKVWFSFSLEDAAGAVGLIAMLKCGAAALLRQGLCRHLSEFIGSFQQAYRRTGIPYSR